ncbi:MAG: hypothetical protein SFV81_17270 [Pirellulaceae bacterium]|nr:hypothetical protein [Pirellulaceae bacterium]
MTVPSKGKDMSDEVVEVDNTDRAGFDSQFWHIGVREILRPGDEGWLSYFYNHPFPQVKELRTIDVCFNKVIDGTYMFEDLDDMPDFLDMLPKPADKQYYLVYADALTHALPEETYGLKLLGYDLSDWTSVSTLTNCGTWTDELSHIASTVNHYGLLDLEHAERAQILLPKLWNNAPHSKVIIWAVFELRCKSSERTATEPS